MIGKSCRLSRSSFQSRTFCSVQISLSAAVAKGPALDTRIKAFDANDPYLVF